MSPRSTLRRLAWLAPLALMAAGTAQAAWPEKPIRVIVTFAAGGASDIVARAISEPLSKAPGQPVIVDNNPGAGGTLGGLEVVRSAPDGYTLMLSNSAPTSFGHIVGEMARAAMNIQMTHIPYKGGAPVTTDLISGQIPLGIDVITAFVPMVKAGQIRPLAVTTRARSPLLPDVPTGVELGLPQLLAENYFGVPGPAGLPKEVVDKLNAARLAISSDPATVKRFEDLGITSVKLGSAEFAAFLAKQVNDWQSAIKAADVKN